MRPALSQAAALLEAADRTFRSGDLSAARTLVARATSADPEHLDAWLLRADLARTAGDVDELHEDLGWAEGLTRDVALRSVLSLDRAWALFRAGRTGQAQDLARTLTSVSRDRLGIWTALLDAVGLSEEADRAARQWIGQSPSDASAWLSLANINVWLGRPKVVLEACGQALAAGQASASAYLTLASSKRWTRADDDELGRMQRALGQARNAVDQAHLGYALFKAHDDLGDSEAAWSALQRGARGARAAFPPPLETAAPAPALARRPAVGGPRRSPMPRTIFIVGLPRSGTTLVDRVLSAHSRVRSLGELNTFGLLARTAGEQAFLPYGDLVAKARLRRSGWSAVGAAYRTEVAQMAGGATVTTDKNLQNWLLADGIAQALPEALFVHVRRDPMDSLFGAYKQLFVGGEYRWSFDMADLADHYGRYAVETTTLAERLNDRWIELSYEELVRQPPVMIARLLAACGLEFETACLDPSADPAAVRTLSAQQVREPISDRSIGGWRRYADQLEPLRVRLEACDLLGDHSGSAGAS
ncbi:sulfotransferase [Caulobacter sp. S45]|uniref:tetratricopeptide repeat-containing sulfotransferase family protein n=1 Tax=Caulobacter sp. S45 TaxID=1641861 RepID=UPI001576B770|nr:sulfotransferase [Caulobacter sp. S45]